MQGLNQKWGRFRPRVMRDLRANGVGKTVAENLSKVLAAFAAGLAIFAGCALIYSRVQDSQAPAAASSRVHPVPASSTDPQAPFLTHRTTSHLDPSAPVSPPMRMKPQIPDAVLHPWMSASAAPHGAP